MNEIKRPVLCVVAGPNGSGKTTTTSLLLSNEWTADCEYINPDNIAKDSFGDWNSPDAVLRAAQKATELSIAEIKKLFPHSLHVTKFSLSLHRETKKI